MNSFGFILSCVSAEEDNRDVSCSMMTLEEAESLTTSTLSESPQMTLSNISSQPLSVSMHSEASLISHLSETEKHEIEDTMESETEEYSKDFEEMLDTAATVEETDSPISLPDEKCVAEIQHTNKHVSFPSDTTTDVLYTNDQLSQSAEGYISASEVESPDRAPSSAFAHCAVDELSRGRPKEKLSEEVKEASSMSSSVVAEEGAEVVSREMDVMITEADLAAFQSDLVVYDLKCKTRLILADISVASRGIKYLLTPNNHPSA